MEGTDDTSYEETRESEAVEISSPPITLETVLAPVCASVCTGQCCVSDEIAFQPEDKPTLLTLTTKKRNFQPQARVQTIFLADCLYNPEKSILPLLPICY